MRDDQRVELVRAPQLATSVPYAYSAVAASGFRFVFTAGACPLDEISSIVGVGDVQIQAEQVMSNLSVALEASGARLQDVVKTTVYVASNDRADLVAAWDVVRSAANWSLWWRDIGTTRAPDNVRPRRVSGGWRLPRARPGHRLGRACDARRRHPTDHSGASPPRRS